MVSIRSSSLPILVILVTKTNDEQLEFCKPEISTHLTSNVVSYPVAGLYVIGCAGGWKDVLINSHYT